MVGMLEPEFEEVGHRRGRGPRDLPGAPRSVRSPAATSPTASSPAARRSASCGRARSSGRARSPRCGASRTTSARWRPASSAASACPTSRTSSPATSSRPTSSRRSPGRSLIDPSLPAPRPVPTHRPPGEQIREIVASELERLGDDRLELVTVTAVEVDGSLDRAVVYYSAFHAAERGPGRRDRGGPRRSPLADPAGRQPAGPRTPYPADLASTPDEQLLEALRIEELLHGLRRLTSGADPGTGGLDHGGPDCGRGVPSEPARRVDRICVAP